MPKIVNLEPHNFSRQAQALLSRHFSYQEVYEDKISEEIFNAEAIIVRFKRRIDQSLADLFPNLKYIVSATTGTDHIDMNYCSQRNIQVLCLKPFPEFLQTIPSTAEHAVALMLSLVRNIPSAVNSVREGQWNRDNFWGRQLKHKTLGIIGLGRTGSKVAQIADVLGMRVMYVDPYVSRHQQYTACSSLEQLIENSDIISLHVHLSEETFHLIDNPLKDYFNSDKYLVNTSRGKVVNEQFLYSLLKEKLIGGIATDVLEDEFNNVTSNWLHKAMMEGRNVIITPHIGGATIDALHSCEEFICERLVEIYQHQHA